MLVLAASTHLLVSLAALLVAGAALLVQAASSNTLLQTIVDEDKRGRVMSLFAMAFMGMAPFGSLLAGSVATELGIRWTLALAAWYASPLVVLLRYIPRDSPTDPADLYRQGHPTGRRRRSPGSDRHSRR